MIMLLGFIISGILGAFLYLLCWTKKASELMDYNNYKRLLIGAIVGYIYFLLHSEYNFPNGIMALVAGYMGTDFIEALISRFKPLEKQSNEQNI